MILYRHKTFLLLVSAFLLLFTHSFCKKDKNDNPGKYVDIYININDPSFSNLYAVGGWVYITGGVRGILVYRRSNTDFMAYDRYCTYEPNDPNAVTAVDSTNVMVKDSKCGSKYIITDGSVSVGPATLPLKAYATSFDGAVVHIFN